MSLVGGYTFVDRLSWSNYNEAGDLSGQIETYRQRFGVYPESVHADQIYRNRENRGYCKSKRIRLSGPRLGRQKKEIDGKEKKLTRQDELIRNAIEGKFGQGKRRFGLDCIRAKLPVTRGSVIAMTFLVMNLEKPLREVLLRFLKMLPFTITSHIRLCFSFIGGR